MSWQQGYNSYWWCIHFMYDTWKIVLTQFKQTKLFDFFTSWPETHDRNILHYMIYFIQNVRNRIRWKFCNRNTQSQCLREIFFGRIGSLGQQSTVFLQEVTFGTSPKFGALKTDKLYSAGIEISLATWRINHPEAGREVAQERGEKLESGSLIYTITHWLL